MANTEISKYLFFVQKRGEAKDLKTAVKLSSYQDPVRDEAEMWVIKQTLLMPPRKELGNTATEPRIKISTTNSTIFRQFMPCELGETLNFHLGWKRDVAKGPPHFTGRMKINLTCSFNQCLVSSGVLKTCFCFTLPLFFR